MITLEDRKRIECTVEEKKSLLPLIDEITEASAKFRKQGLLGLEEVCNNTANELLKQGLEFAIDGKDLLVMRNEIKQLLGSSQQTGVDLLSEYIIVEGVLSLAEGYVPRITRDHLNMYLGLDTVVLEESSFETESKKTDTENPFECTLEEKKDLLYEIDYIVHTAETTREHGLLSLEFETIQNVDGQYPIVKKIMEYMVDGLSQKDIREIMTPYIVASFKTGKELFSDYIIMEGLLGILNGDNPEEIRTNLTVYLMQTPEEVKKQFNETVLEGLGHQKVKK